MDDVIVIVVQGSQEFVNVVVRYKQFDVGLIELGQYVVGQFYSLQVYFIGFNNQDIDFSY